jgi:hypothetical protein
MVELGEPGQRRDGVAHSAGWPRPRVTDPQEGKMEHQEQADTPTMLEQAQAAGSSVASTVRETAAGLSQGVASFTDVVQRYPVPAVLLGMGLGYLIAPVFASRGRWRETVGRPGASTFGSLGSTVQQATQDLAHSAAETAGALSEQAREVGASAARQLQEATAGMARQAEPALELGRQYPIASLALMLGLGYWLASRSRP